VKGPSKGDGGKEEAERSRELSYRRGVLVLRPEKRGKRVFPGLGKEKTTTDNDKLVT